MPLLVLHGWPGTLLQMLMIIPLLTDPAGHGSDAVDAFDVIVPDLPGYRFSDRPTERGMSVARIAELMHRLMTEELGYERYAARASDLGAGVVQQLALAHAEALAGVHMGGTNPMLAGCRIT